MVKPRFYKDEVFGGRCVGYGWIGGQRNGWFAKVDNVFLRLAGLQKLITDLDMRNGHKGGVKVGFIYIKDMNNNDGGKGGAYVYEAYEAK